MLVWNCRSNGDFPDAGFEQHSFMVPSFKPLPIA